MDAGTDGHRPVVSILRVKKAPLYLLTVFTSTLLYLIPLASCGKKDAEHEVTSLKGLQALYTCVNLMHDT